MASNFCCGFECGVNGAHWTGSGTYTTTNARNGRCLNLVSSQSVLAVNFTAGGAGFYVARFYIRFATLPASNIQLFYVHNSGSWTNSVGITFNSSDSKLYSSIGTTLGASGISVTTGTWYRIDFRSQTPTGTHTIDFSVNGTAGTSVTAANGLGASPSSLGYQIDITGDLNVDDFLSTNTSGDYPIGKGHVYAFVPNSDGTHTGLTTDFQKGTTGTPTGGGNIISGTTDSFNWINGKPLLGGATDNTRLVNAVNTASTKYCEWGFEDAIDTSIPRHVTIVTADRQAATAAGTSSAKILDNGVETTIFSRTSGSISDRFASSHYAVMPGDSAAWTLVRFNALKLRFGYSSDANPDQYLRGAMIEAEFLDSVSRVPRPTSIGHPFMF